MALTMNKNTFGDLTWRNTEDHAQDPYMPTWAGQPIEPWMQFNPIPKEQQFDALFDNFQPTPAPQKPLESLIRTGLDEGDGYWRLGLRPGDQPNKVYSGGAAEAGVFRIEPYTYEPGHKFQASSIKIYAATERGVWVPVVASSDGSLGAAEDNPYDRATGTYQNSSVFLMGNHPSSGGIVLKHEVMGTYVNPPPFHARDGSADPIQATGETAGSVPPTFLLEDRAGRLVDIVNTQMAREKQWSDTRQAQMSEDQSHYPHWRPPIDSEWLDKAYAYHLQAPHI